MSDVYLSRLSPATHHVEMIHDLLLDGLLIDFSELEAQCLNDVHLLHIAHGVEEQGRLTIMIRELGSTHALLHSPRQRGRLVEVSAVAGGHGVRGAEPVGPVVWPLVDRAPHVAVALGVEDGTDGSVDGQLAEVDAAETGGLSVEVGEGAQVKQRIAGWKQEIEVSRQPFTGNSFSGSSY